MGRLVFRRLGNTYRMWSRSQGREDSVVDIWWTLHLKRDPVSVPLARRILLGAMDTAGVDPQISHEIGIALTEACANAVEHAVGGEPDHGFQVTASIDGDRLRIEVMNSGPDLPLADAPPRSALSLPLKAAAAQARTDRAPTRDIPPGSDVQSEAAVPGAAPRPAPEPTPLAVPVAPVAPVAPVGRTPARQAPRCNSRRGRTTVISRAAVMASLTPAASARRLRSPDRPGPYDTHVLDIRPVLAAPMLDFGTEPPDLPDLTAESGRGLFLIRALADHVQFRSHPRRGTILSFDKILKWRDDSLLRAS
jgi:serine/threonine-protein kinase RsbW